jgi:DNA-binding transcriptional LysR family regulator
MAFVDLNELVVFARVVQVGSFTAAAAELGMPKSTVSRKVSALEERLGARLLQRTTRKLSLTDEGRAYYDHASRIAVEIEDAERAVSSLRSAPRGLLRVTAGVNAGWLGPIVSDYLLRHPDVQLELYETERTVDLIEERFDVGVRAGTLGDSSLIARRLADVRWFLVASRRYLARRGRPRTPADLAGHDLAVFGAGARVTLRLERDGQATELSLAPRLVVRDVELLHATVRAGLGIGLLPAYRCVAELRGRRFERVLAAWEAPPTPIHAVYPSARHVSPKVKSFVDHLVARMTPPPW